MNKTVNINLGGLFFHIDENAYQKLKRYLDAISLSLNDDPKEKEEIIKDIEQRIGELLSEKMSSSQQVVNESNIDEIIATMGQPEEYAFDEELFERQASQKKHSKKRKMYRDGRDKILGGVSSGLSHYFGIDVAWIRIILVVSTLLGLGVGVIAYIVLWIVLPEAISTADQLEMKGEPVNIDNIERKIKEEYSKIEEKLKNTDYSGLKSGFQDMIDTLGKLLGGSLKVIGKLIGILLLIIASIVLVASLIGLLYGGSFELFHFNGQHMQLPPIMETSLIPKGISLIMLILALAIPFVFLFVLGLNILSEKKKEMGSVTNLSLIGIWIISILGIVFTGIEFSSKYASKSTVTTNTDYTITAKDTLRIKMIANHRITDREDVFYATSHTDYVKNSAGADKLYSSNIDLDVRSSSTGELLVKVMRSTKGYNKDFAMKNAELIDYDYKLLDNNSLELSAFFLTDTKLNNNSPKVKVIVYVPSDIYVYFDPTTKYFISDIKNKQRIADREMISHYFLMNNLEFTCTDCEQEPERTENGVKLKIDKEGVNFSVTNGKESAHVKIDSTGMEIR